MRTPALIIAVVAAASLAVTGCGSSHRPTTLDTGRVAQAIAQSSLAQRGIHARVTCPSGELQRKGLVFSCVAITEQGSARFVVTELDGSGHVHYDAP